ncbi:DegT/DnrJ/EryC1/StrS family aminotransferase [Candidatus Pacearchaeota archaeon]|nr:DegT/DnrJ/EryC1/StrS family aminotransferase [Candidatus Pacearchaeota archaeon]
MRVEFGDLRLDEAAKENLLDCIAKNWISGGPKVKQFEEEWGNLFGYKHNFAVYSGTGGDIGACMALYDLGAQRGDEIIAPALAFAAVGEAILQAGFKPVFVDVEKETLNIDPKIIEQKITPRTRAILVAHTMGKPCEMDSIMEIARKHNLIVIEDSCEAHGAKYKGKFIGNWGDMAVFSFYIAHLICCGEGGMISTNNERIAQILSSVRSHGRKGGQLYFDHERLGSNLKMNDMEAAVGLSEVKKFWWTFDTRKKNLIYLLYKMKDLQKYAYFNLEGSNDVVCAHGFTVTMKDPKYNCAALYRFLEDNSIKCKRNFGSMPTQHKAFAFLGHKLGEFPESEYIGDHGLHFGVHQFLSLDDLDYISEKMHEYFKRFE